MRDLPKLFYLTLLFLLIAFSAPNLADADDLEDTLSEIIKNTPGFAELIACSEAIEENESCGEMIFSGSYTIETFWKPGSVKFELGCIEKIINSDKYIIDCDEDGEPDPNIDTWVHMQWDLRGTFNWLDEKCQKQTFTFRDKRNNWMHFPDGKAFEGRGGPNVKGWSRSSNSGNIVNEKIGGIDPAKCPRCAKVCKAPASAEGTPMVCVAESTGVESF
ncbi:hypothetical protein JNK13_03415 [bacterium]|nr:hypothetical protein [bacterium]